VHAGIYDLLRVLSQRASEVLKSAEEEEDDMEVEQSEGEGDSSGSEDDALDLDEEEKQQLKVCTTHLQHWHICSC
jgi:flagellar biosynthesis/type III secretory pathway M-ring protein FliF/YscJ